MPTLSGLIRKLKSKKLSEKEKISTIKTFLDQININDPNSDFWDLIKVSNLLKSKHAKDLILKRINSGIIKHKKLLLLELDALSKATLIDDVVIEHYLNRVDPLVFFRRGLKPNWKKTNSTLPGKIFKSVQFHFKANGFSYVPNYQENLIRFTFYSDNNQARLIAAKELYRSQHFKNECEETSIDLLAFLIRYLLSKDFFSTKDLVDIVKQIHLHSCDDIKDFIIKQIMISGSLTPPIAKEIFPFIRQPDMKRLFIDWVNQTLAKNRLIGTPKYSKYQSDLQKNKFLFALSGFRRDITSDFLILEPGIPFIPSLTQRKNNFVRVIGFESKNKKNQFICISLFSDNRFIALDDMCIHDAVAFTDKFFPGLG